MPQNKTITWNHTNLTISSHFCWYLIYDREKKVNKQVLNDKLSEKQAGIYDKPIE